MSILTMIKSIKQIHSKDVVFVKLGKFYYCYGKDAYIISYFFEYKLNLIENTIYSCGFPRQSLNKIIAKLEKKKINYVIIDRRNNYEVQEVKNFKNLNSYEKYFEKAKEKIGVKLRIQRIGSYLLGNSDKNNIRGLLAKIEKILQEYKFEKE